MDGENDESIDYLIADLAVFYKGSIGYAELKDMPIPELHNLDEYAERMVKEAKKEAERQQPRIR